MWSRTAGAPATVGNRPKIRENLLIIPKSNSELVAEENFGTPKCRKSSPVRENGKVLLAGSASSCTASPGFVRMVNKNVD